MRWHPASFGGTRIPPEEIKRLGWREQRLLVISPSDPRLTWPERQLVCQLGERLYGDRKAAAGGRHG